MSDERKTISFPVNEHDWILLFEILGSKIYLRAHNIKFSPKKQPISDEYSQHRIFQIEAEGSAKVQSKFYDTSKLLK